jgi:phage shock protein A
MRGTVSILVKTLKDGLEALFAPAEDPRLAFDCSLDRQRQLLAKVKQALQDIGVAKSRLKTKADEIHMQIPQLKEQARSSLDEGREDLARLALRRAEIAAAELQTMQQQLRIIDQDERQLSLIERQLSAYLETFYARQEYLLARYSAAEVQVQICEALTGVSDELAQLGQVLELADGESERMLARAVAIERLVENGLLEMPASQLPEIEVTDAPLPDDSYQQELSAVVK